MSFVLSLLMGELFSALGQGVFIFISVFKLAQMVLICWRMSSCTHFCYPYFSPHLKGQQGVIEAPSQDRPSSCRCSCFIPFLSVFWRDGRAGKGRRVQCRTLDMPDQKQRPVEALITQKQDYSIRD